MKTVNYGRAQVQQTALYPTSSHQNPLHKLLMHGLFIIMVAIEFGLHPTSMIREDGLGLVLSSSRKPLIYCMKDT